jgi:hypothetical protein
MGRMNTKSKRHNIFIIITIYYQGNPSKIYYLQRREGRKNHQNKEERSFKVQKQPLPYYSYIKLMYYIEVALAYFFISSIHKNHIIIN